MNLFGPLVSGTDVSNACQAFIKRWQTTYLAEIERHTLRTPQSLPVFRSFVESVNTDRFGEDQLPSCVIVTPGLLERPIRHGDGMVENVHGVGVAAIVSAKDRESTNTLARDYAAMLRMMFMQHQSIDGFAHSTEWLDERYDPLPFDESRSISAGMIQLAVKVYSAMNTQDGPVDVPADPYADPGDWTTVEHVFVTVTPARG